MTKNILFIAAVAVALLFGQCRPAHAGSMVKALRAPGSLTCGVVTEETDYTKFDTHGDLHDIGSEACKAVAVAVLGAKAQTKTTVYPDEQTALEALAAGNSTCWRMPHPPRATARCMAWRSATRFHRRAAQATIEARDCIRALASTSTRSPLV